MENSHLALIYDEQVPSSILDQFCCDIEANSLDVRRHSLLSGKPQGSLDTLFLTAIAFFVFKSYFDGFLKEAGRDHYVILKKALKSLWSQLFSKEVNFQVAILTSRGEVKSKHSFLFSIYVEINNGRKVKFLIREGCSEDEYVAGIDAFLALIESYYLNVPYEGIEIALDDEKDYWGNILIEFDPETKSLRVLDPIFYAKNRTKM